jgi:hypothetical protein
MNWLPTISPRTGAYYGTPHSQNRKPGQERKNMPIASFSSFTDGLDHDQRSREHFIAGIGLEDERL